jgi:hypothetical protein
MAFLMTAICSDEVLMLLIKRLVDQQNSRKENELLKQ